MQEGVNKRYTIELTTLTPLSIGAGAEHDWVKGADFVIDNHKLYKLNLKKMLAEGIDIGKISALLQGHDDSGIKKLLGGKLEKVSDSVYDCPLDTVDNDVKAFIKNQLNGNPIIPGSSLKGAIRSVLFNYLGGRTKDGNEVFGEVKNGENLMRFIKISDAEFKETMLLNTKIFNLYKDGFIWKGGWKHAGGKKSLTDSFFKPTGFNTIYETIGKNQKGYCDIMFSTDIFKKNVSNMPGNPITTQSSKPSEALNIYQLFSIINKHTSEHIKKDLDFYNKYSNDKTPQISDCLRGLLKSMTDNDSCVIKMSAGSGFHSITGDWQFDDYSIDGIEEKNGRTRGEKGGKKSAKSRKIIIDGDDFMPMGFIRMRILSPEECRQRRDEQSEQLNARAEKMREDRERAEALVKAEQQRRQEEQARKDKFEQLIQYLQAHLHDDDLCKLQELLSEAESLCPNESILLELKENVQKKKKEIELAELKKIIAQSDSDKYKCSLSEKLANINNIKTAFGNIKAWLKNNQKESLTEQDKQELKEALTRIFNSLNKRDQKKLSGYNNWKELEVYIGEDAAHSWYSSITGNSL